MKATAMLLAALFSMAFARAATHDTIGTAPSFTFTASGAVEVAVTSNEVRYGLTPERGEGRPVLNISLGANTGSASLGLYTSGDRPLRPGRYAVLPAWPGEGSGNWFHASLVAGTVERPVGVFHSESGWVTITRAEPGQLSGEFLLHTRGFLAADMDDEDQWVTVRGTFVADGDGSIAAIQSVTELGQ
jgi:hypothetical protein